MDISEEYLLKTINKYETELSTQKRIYESEIKLLKSKIEYSKNKNDADLENRFENEKSKLKAYYDVKNTTDLENQKQYFMSELELQKNWYEQEIVKRQEETAKWHIKNNEEKINELTADFEKKLAEKEEIIKALKDEVNKLVKENEVVSGKLLSQTGVVKSSDTVAQKEDYVFDKAKVSVILPVYNVGKYLRQSLDSIINQTLKELEIICVNDGSTDDSYDILEEYKQKDNRIKVIHKDNKGTGAARNDGLRIATGECIGFVDPDDWIKPEMFERLYGLIREKDLDIAMCMPDGYDERNNVNAPFPYFVDDNWNVIPDDRIFNWRDLSPFKYPMCVWNKLYKKELFDKHNIEYAEGLDFEDHKVIFGTLLTAEKIFFIKEKLYVYRYNREGSVLSDNNRRLIDHMEIFNVVEQLMKDTDTFNALRNDFLEYKIHNVLYYYGMIKPEFKPEYYANMIKCIEDTNLTEKEYSYLCEKYPELSQLVP